jgi:hypothetical protein
MRAPCKPRAPCELAPGPFKKILAQLLTLALLWWEDPAVLSPKHTDGGATFDAERLCLSPDSEPAADLILGFPASGTVGSRFLFFMNFPFCGILLQQQSKTYVKHLIHNSAPYPRHLVKPLWSSTCLCIPKK